MSKTYKILNRSRSLKRAQRTLAAHGTRLSLFATLATTSKAVSGRCCE